MRHAFFLDVTTNGVIFACCLLPHFSKAEILDQSVRHFQRLQINLIVSLDLNRKISKHKSTKSRYIKKNALKYGKSKEQFLFMI